VPECIAHNAREVLSAIRSSRKGPHVVYWRTKGAKLQLADSSAKNGGLMKYLEDHPAQLIGVYSAENPPSLEELVEDINASTEDLGEFL